MHETIYRSFITERASKHFAKFTHFVQALNLLNWLAVKILRLTVQVLPTNPSPQTPPSLPGGCYRLTA